MCQDNNEDLICGLPVPSSPPLPTFCPTTHAIATAFLASHAITPSNVSAALLKSANAWTALMRACRLAKAYRAETLRNSDHRNNGADASWPVRDAARRLVGECLDRAVARGWLVRRVPADDGAQWNWDWNWVKPGGMEVVQWEEVVCRSLQHRGEGDITGWGVREEEVEVVEQHDMAARRLAQLRQAVAIADASAEMPPRRQTREAIAGILFDAEMERKRDELRGRAWGWKSGEEGK